jgi:hypothetical protein
METYMVEQTVVKRAARKASFNTPIQTVFFQNFTDMTSPFVRQPIGNYVNAAHTILPVSHERDTTEIYSSRSQSSEENNKSPDEIVCFDNDDFYDSNEMETYDVSESTNCLANTSRDDNVDRPLFHAK